MSSALLFLSNDDFQIREGQKGNLLCNNINGISLILFYSTKCVHCKELVPIFKSLVGTIGGVQFGIINVSVNKEIIQKASQTITEIRFVPLIILYVNNKPFMVYKGNRTAQDIQKFVVDVATNIQKKQSFSQKQGIKEDTKKGMFEYCLGKPLCGDDDDVCFLPFESAYPKGAPNQQQARGRRQ